MSENALSVGSTTPGRYGAGPAQVVLAEATIATAWNVQGDATQPLFVAEVQRLFDVALPTTPNTTSKGSGVTVFWIGPRSWLLVTGEPPSASGPFSNLAANRDALNALGGALFDLSAGRIAFTITGEHAVEVLASGCPLDLHPRVFSAGACAQSIFGHVNALVYKPDETTSFTLLVARSFARDAWQALCLSAAQYGYDVTSRTPFRLGLTVVRQE